jgi:integrase
LALGLGREPDDAYVFRRADGSPLSPDTTSSEWRRLLASRGLPKVSLHALRHTHASQLIASGMDVLTISRRLGHGTPSVTLDVYSHLFKPTDRGAAAVFDKAFGGLRLD